MSQSNIVDRITLAKVFSFYWGCRVLLPAQRKVITIDERFFHFYSDYHILKQCRIVTLGNYSALKEEETEEMKELVKKYDYTVGAPVGTLLRSFYIVQYYLRNGYAIPLIELGGRNIIEAEIGITEKQLEEILNKNK